MFSRIIHPSSQDYWEPFEKYEVGNCAVKDARRMFYQAVREKVDAHLGDKEPFHTRIVQVPKEFAGKPLPFQIDEIFFDYLKHVADKQEKYPLSCLLKKTIAHRTYPRHSYLPVVYRQTFLSL